MTRVGEGVGQIYVQRHYPPESDRQMHELIDNILAALKEKIETNTWMDAPTKARAVEKLATFDPRIGHPVKYIDYSSLAVKRDDLLGNAIRSDNFQWKLLLSRYHQAGRPRPVGHAAADQQRLLRPDAEPDHLPGRDPAAALFRSQRRSRFKLRQHRRDDRT